MSIERKLVILAFHARSTFMSPSCSCCSGQWASRQLWWINPTEEIGLSNVKSTLVLGSNSWRRKGRGVRISMRGEVNGQTWKNLTTLEKESVCVCVCVCVCARASHKGKSCSGLGVCVESAGELNHQKPLDQSWPIQGLRPKLWSPIRYLWIKRACFLFINSLHFVLNVWFKKSERILNVGVF